MKNTQKTFSVLTIIFALFINQLTLSEVSYLAIKGLHTSIKPEKGHLSPVHGFVWWKSGQIEKLYRYGVDSDKTIQLIKKLFYLNPTDNITFDCTKTPTNVASFFSATTIGTIMRELETVGMEMETDYEQTKSDLKATLKDELSRSLPQNIKEKTTTYTQLAPQLKQLSAETTQLTNEQKLKTAQLRRFKKDKKTLEQKVPQKPEKITEIDQKIAKTEQEVRDLKEQIQTKQATLVQTKATLQQLTREIFSPNAVDTMVDLVFEAYQESLPGDTQKYIPYTIHNILLGFLLRKATSKQELLDYLAAVGADILVITDILQKNSTAQQEWLTEAYTQKELSNFESFFKSIQENQTPFEKFEQLVVYLHNYDISAQPFPPQIIGGNPIYRGIILSGCGETSLRNFFNNILYNQETKTFDFSIAEKAFGKENIHSRLKDFYKSPLSAIDNVNSTKTLNKWAEVVSGLNVPEKAEQITYRQPEMCEIDASISNMLKVINRIIGVNNFNDLVDKLNKAGLPITIDDKSKDNFGEIHFTIENRGTFVWYFQSHHFYITVETKASKSSEVDKAMSIISQLISNSTTAQQNNALLNLIMLYKDKKNLEQSLVTTLQNTFSPTYILHAYLLLYNLNNNEEKLKCIEEILENNILGDLPDNLSLDALIIKIIDALPSDDPYRSQIISTIAKNSNALKKSEKLRNQITKSAQEITSDHNKVNVISKLLNSEELLNKIPELKTLIENIAKSITGDYDKVYAISKLLEAKESLNTIPELKTLISDIATSITDDDKKLETIHKLLEAKELFNTIPELQTLISEIAQNVNPKSITDDYQKVKTISKLLAAKELLNTIPELTTLIEKIATSITGDHPKVNVISELLKSKELLNKIPELKTLISDIATSITVDYQKVGTISNLLKSKELINTPPELKTLIENIALSITVDYQKVNVISELLEAKELLTQIPELTTLISDITTSITVDYMKVDTISNLLKSKELINTPPELLDLIEKIATSIKGSSHLKTVLENITNNKEIPDNQKQLIIQKLKGLLQIPESPH